MQKFDKAVAKETDEKTLQARPQTLRRWQLELRISRRIGDRQYGALARAKIRRIILAEWAQSL